MGEVYAATDEHLDREVAVKVLGSAVDVEPHRRRFLREARLAARLNHPNIASIYEVGDSDGRLYIVMELLEGQPLRNLLNDRRLKMDEIISIARDVARALARAHTGDVIHRDIKPENIFVTKPAPDVLFAKVLDFGLARDELLRKSRNDEDNTATDLTGPGEACGTAGYLAPEQARGLAVDVRADIFSFGAVLYEMLTGKRAFDGRNQLQRMLAVVKHKPEPVRLLAPEISPELEDVLTRCLSKAPADRYADGGALLAAIEQLVRASQSKLPPVTDAEVGQVDLSSRHLISDISLDETVAMPGAPATPPELPSTSSSAAILAADAVEAADPDRDLASGDASSSRAKVVASSSSSAPPTKTSGSHPRPRAKSEPIPYPVLAKWLSPTQVRQIKPLALVGAGGLLLSLCIILSLSLSSGGSARKKASAARIPEVAAARELTGAADGLGPKNPSSETDPAKDDDGSKNDEAPTPTPVAAATRTTTTGFTKLPSVRSAPTPVAPTPPPPPTPAVAPVAKPTTGTVHVNGSELTIVVDGEYRRLNGGSVVLSCGRHRVRVGVRADQIVDVPCGGTISL